MMRYRHTRDKHGEPVWVIEVTGWHDIYRFAANMLYQQVEFAAAGRKALQWARRSLGSERFEAGNRTLNGTTKYAEAVTRASIRPRARSRRR